MPFKNHGLPAWLTYRRIFVFILALNLVTRLILLSRPLPYLDGKLMPDDTYLSLQVAKNIANGNGPLYSDNYTNGYQPLYVFLMVPVFALSSEQIETPIKIALLMLSFFDTATLAVLLIWIYSLTRDIIIIGISSVFWIFSDYVIRTSLNGLETIIASFFIILASYLFYSLYYIKPQRKILDFLWLGLIAGFACLTRVDSGILALMIGLLIVTKEWRSFPALLLRGAVYAAGVLSIFSIWVAYSVYYTGEWYPESGKAVRFLSLAHVGHNPTWKWYLDMVLRAGYEELLQKGVLILAVITLSVYAFRRKVFTVSVFKPILSLVLFCSSILLAYTFYIFTPWYFDRYFFPLTMLYILMTAILLHQITPVLKPGHHTIVYASVLFVWFAVLFGKAQYLDYFVGGENRNAGYRNLGLWAKENLPPGTVVGSSQSGALSYFATELKVINLDGVVNRDCFNSLQQGTNMDYIRDSEIDYVFGWKNNIHFIKQHSKNFKESDLIFVQKIDGFRSWNNEWYLYKVNQ